MNYVNKQNSPESKSTLDSKKIKNPKFLDRRTITSIQLEQQEMMDASLTSELPIQAVWQWEKIKTNPGKWKWVDPKNVGNKREKPPFDGTEHGEKYPSIEKVDLAAKHKEDQIAQYISLLPHLKGEYDGDTGVKGGHVWKMMQAEWGDELHLVSGEANADAPWQCTWRIGTRTEKGSTMFPGSWDEAKLTEELRKSSLIGGQLVLGNVKLKKAGDTFYPDV